MNIADPIVKRTEFCLNLNVAQCLFTVVTQSRVIINYINYVYVHKQENYKRFVTIYIFTNYICFNRIVLGELFQNIMEKYKLHLMIFIYTLQLDMKILLGIILFVSKLINSLSVMKVSFKLNLMIINY